MLKLVQEVKGEIVGLGFLVQLGFLDGKDKLDEQGYTCLLTL